MQVLLDLLHNEQTGLSPSHYGPMSRSSIHHEVADFTFRLFLRHSSHAILVRPCALEPVVEFISKRFSLDVLDARRSPDPFLAGRW